MKGKVIIKSQYYHDISTGEKVKLVDWYSGLYGFAEVEQPDGSTYLAKHSQLSTISKKETVPERPTNDSE